MAFSIFSKIISGSCLFGCLFLFCGCAQIPETVESDQLPKPKADDTTATFSPAQQYAGEILSYMMQVTLGKAGKPKLRQEWGQRGLTLPLDFDRISNLMLGPEKQPSQVMVLDNNILGLSQVLYHYDKGLNLFKGKGAQVSLFPSTELLSIRVMLLQKMYRGEKVGMGELMKKKAQFLDPGVLAQEIVLDGVCLNASEIKLLKDVAQSDPSFMTYLEHPAIVETLYRIGAVDMDPYVRKKIQFAHHNDAGLSHVPDKERQKTVLISILPSMVDAFDYQGIDREIYPSGFAPDDMYNRDVQKLIDTLSRYLQKLIMAQMFGDRAPMDSTEEKTRHESIKALLDTHLDIVAVNQRPLVVYPENAERVVHQVCGDADFSVIVMGKNVYLSMYISDVDTFPHVNRVYLDVLDIRHGQADYEISQISMFAFNKLKPHLPSPE